MSLFNLRKGRAATVAPTFNAVDLGGGEVDVTLFGDVISDTPRDWDGKPVEGQYISCEDVVARLSAIDGASHVTVHLNSCGGDLFAGVAIHNALKKTGAKVTVRVEGIAASSASVIACAGDEVVVMPGSIFMVHQPALCLFGFYNSTDLDALKSDLDAGFRSVCNIYEEKTGADRASIEEMVRAETWMVGQEAVDAGFADTLDTGSPSPEVEEGEDGGELIVNGIRHDMSACRSVPKLAALAPRADNKETPGHLAVSPVSDSKEPPRAAQDERGTSTMNVTELREQHPDLVAEIEAAAAQSERDRIAAIDEISATCSPELVAKAKAEGMTAEQMALAAMKQSAAAGAAYMAAAKSDGDESGAEGVGSAPTDPAEDEKVKEEQQARADIEAAIELHKKMKGAL